MPPNGIHIQHRCLQKNLNYDLTSLKTPPLSISATISFKGGTLLAKVLYSLEYLALVPSVVRARASKLTASGNCSNVPFISSKLKSARADGLGRTRITSPPLGSWTRRSDLITSSQFEFAPHFMMKGAVVPVLNCSTFHCETSLSPSAVEWKVGFEAGSSWSSSCDCRHIRKYCIKTRIETACCSSELHWCQVYLAISGDMY
jgi:hypothetical protein